MAYDLKIKGGTVIDGTGKEGYVADIGIVGDKIVEIGALAGPAEREIDAAGMMVTPGFVDIHTHYDAQVTFANHINSSSWHGVTTALIGNCGVGFAPCKPTQRDMLVKLMEGVEDIPEVVLTTGLPWDWETFPQFLDRLDARRYDLDVVTQMPHAALRVYVMGQRGADREPSTDADRKEMARLTKEALDVGAIGFSTSRTIAHKSIDGKPTPTLDAAEAELMEIAGVLGDSGNAWFQVITDFDDENDEDEEFALFQRLAERTGGVLSFSMFQKEVNPDMPDRLLKRLRAANENGIAMRGQVIARGIGVLLGLEISQNPFMARPSFREIAHLPFEDKVKALRDPERRARILSEDTADPAFRWRVATWQHIYEMSDPVDFEPLPSESMTARATRAGVTPDEFTYDLLLENDGRKILWRGIGNYAAGNLDVAAEMLQHPDTIVGLGDGGAHVSIISDFSAQTSTLTHWARDRERGAKLPLPFLVRRLSADNARAIGLNDRGVIAPGYKADLNIIDFDRLRVHYPQVAYDLPGNARRLIQKADGYVATIVSGVPVHLEGEPTGELPGRLVRGTRAAPVAIAAE